LNKKNSINRLGRKNIKLKENNIPLSPLLIKIDFIRQAIDAIPEAGVEPLSFSGFVTTASYEPQKPFSFIGGHY